MRKPRPSPQTKSTAQPAAAGDDGDQLLWGAAAIAEELQTTVGHIYGLIRAGVFDGAIEKRGHRTIVTTRRRARRAVLGNNS